MSVPSILRSPGTCPPASLMNVGRMSISLVTASHDPPAGTFPGQSAIVGSRIPPSQVLALNPRRGALLAERVPPLSEVNRTSVLSDRPSSRIVSSTFPQPQSTSSTQSLYVPCPLCPRHL